MITGLNNDGSVIGYVPYSSVSFITHPDGYTVPFSVPLPTSQDCGFASTVAEGINAEGDVVGRYSNYPAATADHCQTSRGGGFIRSAQGDFTFFAPPGTIANSPLTLQQFVSGQTTGPSLSLNDNGTVSGTYTDTANVSHGFVRNLYGTIFSFDPPRGRSTTVTGINNSDIVVGYYDWNDPSPVGFLRIPDIEK